MPASHPDNPHYLLNGKEELGADYDEQADILYLWRGEGPRDAVSLTSNEGHLVRLDPDSAEIVGFTIFDFSARWQDEGHTVIPINIPGYDLGRGVERTAPRSLELTPIL